MERALFGQLKRSRERDGNPYRRGYKKELINSLGALFPRVSRIELLSLPLDGRGWLGGDSLYRWAETAERRGSGLLELQVPENQVLLLGLDPAESGRLWPAPAAPFEGRPEGSPLSACPLWGPCLGERADLQDLVLELLGELAPDWDDGLRVFLAGCPRDCRRLIETADLLIAVEDRKSGFSLHLGGRRRPFRPLILPRPWKIFPPEKRRELAAQVSRIRDRFPEKRLADETLPEAAARLGERRFERLFALK
ncbi:MAG: hypothetical protein LBR53_00840 [Deltaproteobacteria bacterium]|nr:hypothetical protein [Deltaproteobacteria bacterium]